LFSGRNGCLQPVDESRQVGLGDDLLTGEIFPSILGGRGLHGWLSALLGLLAALRLCTAGQQRWQTMWNSVRYGAPSVPIRTCCL
jgi:hypothetical protein